MNHPQPHRFIWRPGNSVEILRDGGEFFPAMLEAIKQARHYVLIEEYLAESGRVWDRFAEALTEAAKRQVAVFALFDDYGCRGVSRAVRRRLGDSGVHVRYYNPLHYGRLRQYLFRNHRKLLVVDGEVAFTGGAGLSDTFDPADKPQLRWRENMVRIRGPVVADWVDMFCQIWERTGTHRPQLPAAPEWSGGPYRARAVGNLSYRHNDVKRVLVGRMHGARRRLWVCTAYFVPSHKFRQAFRRAARNGVDVRILTPGRHSDHPSVIHAGRRFYSRLLSSGVRIFEYQPRFIHAKYILCDDWAALGSTNVDRWTLRWNLEANQEVLDADFAAQVAAMFEQDSAHAEEIVYEKWHQRHVLRKFLEWFWGSVDRLLTRL